MDRIHRDHDHDDGGHAHDGDDAVNQYNKRTY